MFADREAASLAPRETHHHALNDNVPSGEGPSLTEILYLRRGLGQPGGALGIAAAGAAGGVGHHIGSGES